MNTFRTDPSRQLGRPVHLRAVRTGVAGLPVALACALGFAIMAASGPVAAQTQQGTGEPIPLLPDNATGTLDPALGETDPAIGNPPLSAPREIGPAPGAARAPASSDQLPPPAFPQSPQAVASPSQAGPGPVASTPQTMTRGNPSPDNAETLAKATAAVAEATATVRELRADSGFKAELNNLLSRARAVAVIPSFFRAGFVVGGAYGSTLLLVRDSAGAFSHPAFFRMSAGSIGLQIGIQDARIILLIMTDTGLNAILKDRFKLEAGANVTFGTVGGGVATGSTTDVNQDIVAVSHSRGLFGGGALEGAVIEPRDDWNAVYYDQPGLRPEAIVLERSIGNPASVPLIEALQDPMTGVR